VTSRKLWKFSNCREKGAT